MPPLLGVLRGPKAAETGFRTCLKQPPSIQPRPSHPVICCGDKGNVAKGVFFQDDLGRQSLHPQIPPFTALFASVCNLLNPSASLKNERNYPVLMLSRASLNSTQHWNGPFLLRVLWRKLWRKLWKCQWRRSLRRSWKERCCTSGWGCGTVSRMGRAVQRSCPHVARCDYCEGAGCHVVPCSAICLGLQIRLDCG